MAFGSVPLRKNKRKPMHTITFSTSTRRYANKPTQNEFPLVTFRTVETTVRGLYESVIEGHVTAYTFNASSAIFGNYDRAVRNFNSTQHIMFDFDYTTIQPKDAEQVLINNGLTPAFYYTTARHTNKAPRYRMCFVLKNPVTDAAEYKRLWELLSYKIESVIPNLTADRKASDAARMFVGHVANEHSTHHFNDDYNEIDVEALAGEFKELRTRKPRQAKRRPKKDYQNYFKDKTLLAFCEGNGIVPIDFKTNPYMVSFFDIFSELILPDKTCVDFNDDEDYRIVGDVYEVKYPRRMLVDGMRRRYNLFANGCKRRLIKPGATFEEILVTLIRDAYMHISFNAEPITYSKDGQQKSIPQEPLTIMDIIQVAVDVMEADENYLKRKIHPLKQKYMINPVLKFTPGYQNRIKTVITNDLVKKLAEDNNLSIESLNRELETVGLKPIKEATYRRKYAPKVKEKKEKKQDTGKKPVKFKKTKQMAKFYNPNISFNACFEIMKKQGIDISRSAVYKYYKKMKENFVNQEISCTFAVEN